MATSSSQETYEAEEGYRYCYCEEENDFQEPMISCDLCRQWYHYSCLKFTQEEALYWSSPETAAVPWHCKECWNFTDDESEAETENPFLDLEAEKEKSESDQRKRKKQRVETSDAE